MVRHVATAVVIAFILGFWGAGQAAAKPRMPQPLDAYALRAAIAVVASPEMGAYIGQIGENFALHYGQQKPQVTLLPARQAVRRFCEGIGADYPDVAASHRRMWRSEFRYCVRNGVNDIVEIGIGSEALFLVASRDTPTFNMPVTALFRALSARVPIGSRFVANAAETWRDVDPLLPDLPIRVLLPAASLPIRSLLDDAGMQGGCREFEAVRRIEAAAERVAACTTLRDDGRIVEFDDAAVIAATVGHAAPGTLALLPRSALERPQTMVSSLPVEGILPTLQAIESGEYPLSRRLFFYVKVAHVNERGGYSVARGLRNFVREVSDEQALAHGGYIARMGVLPPPPAEQVRQRLDALLLRPFSR